MISEFKKAVELLEKNIDFVFNIIVKKNGSGPRNPGTIMLVYEDSIYGTIGGGTLEQLIIKNSMTLLNERRDGEYIYFNLTPQGDNTIGMVCGGSVGIASLYINGNSKGYLEIFKKLVNNPVSSKLLIDIQNFDLTGEINGKIEPFVRNGSADESIVLKVNIPPKVYVLGAGHIAQSLVNYLVDLGYETVVVDDREGLLNHKLFPSSKLILGTHKDIPSIGIENGDYICIVSYTHNNDKLFLEEILKLDVSLKYIGLMASRKKKENFFSDPVIKRLMKNKIVHSPIGLDIGAETPEEIAISISAEIIKQTRL